MHALRRLVTHERTDGFVTRERTYAFVALLMAIAVTGATALILTKAAARLAVAETEATIAAWSAPLADAAARALKSSDGAGQADALYATALAAGEVSRIRVIAADGKVGRDTKSAAGAGTIGETVALSERVLAGEEESERVGRSQSRVLVPVRDAKGAVAAVIEITADASARLARFETWTAGILTTLLALVLGGLLLPILGLFMRAREKKSADARLTHLVQHDTLTDLPNRDVLQDALAGAIETHVGDGRQIALHLVDIDNFRAINDTFGTAAGDALLKEMAGRLGKLVDNPSHIARLGSDEFALIQPEAGGARHAEIFAGRIATTVAQPVAVGDHTLSPTASIGIAIAPDHGKDVRRLLTAADAAMTAVKAAGFNDIRIFKPEMERSSALRFELRNELKEAFDKRWFEIAYQPQYDLKAQRLIGFEALMRLRHPRRGMVSPGDFLPVADELGLVAAINDWLLKESCRAARDWPEGLGVTVNLPQSQFKKKGGGDRILNLCAEAYCPTDRLALDLTETVLALPGERVNDELRKLKNAGVLLFLDDFGTGTSSATQLWKFGFDGFKLDGDVVRAIGVRPGADAFAKALIRFAESLGMTVVAEGVETVEQAGFLVANGCSAVQGFLFGRPVPQAEIDGIIERDRLKQQALLAA